MILYFVKMGQTIKYIYIYIYIVQPQTHKLSQYAITRELRGNVGSLGNRGNFTLCPWWSQEHLDLKKKNYI